MAAVDKILILSSQLRQARESLGLGLEEAAKDLGINPEDLYAWEKGYSQPSVEDLWKLAELYQRSTDYFLRQRPPPEQLNFRLVQRKGISDLPLGVRNVLVRFEELCRAQSELEALLGKQRKILVQRLTNGLSPEEMASHERQRLKQGERPIKNLRTLLTSQGVRIFELDVPGNEVAGISWWHQEYGPCILINAKDNPGRRCFTLAHEYAHRLRSDPSTVCDLKKVEVSEELLANKFAAVFLMPATDLEREFHERVGLAGTVPTENQLRTLANRYGVSLEAVGIRLKELELLKAGIIDSLILEWEQRKQGPHRGSKSPRWRRRLGEGYVSLAFEAHREGHISLGKLAQYLELDVGKALEEVDKEIKAPGGSRSNG
ncbi:MAG: ImmA/IrrE family metallo-endopeptidase [Chloroflexi bacterium]|nr:ImmA/IrrE family metallo-endopeptidase [Chloroflexota bacterium]